MCETLGRMNVMIFLEMKQKEGGRNIVDYKGNGFSWGLSENLETFSLNNSLAN